MDIKLFSLIVSTKFNLFFCSTDTESEIEGGSERDRKRAGLVYTATSGDEGMTSGGVRMMFFSINFIWESARETLLF